MKGIETTLGNPRIPDRTLVDRLRGWVEYQPAQKALTFLQDGTTETDQVTYAELDDAARVIAAHLQALVQPGDRVLLVYPPGLAYITAFLGCLYADAVAVPTYPPRPHRSWNRFEAIAGDAQPRLILTSTALTAVWNQAERPVGQELPLLFTETLTNRAADWRRPEIDPGSPAFLQYTSGSTGSPKGVVISHDNLLHNLKAIQSRFGHSEQSVGVIWLPPYHDMGLIGGILQPLYVGFPVILMSPLACIQRPWLWLQAITRYRGTTSGGPNFAYDWCVDRISDAHRVGLDLSSWEVAFNGAEPISGRTLNRFAKAFAPFGFRRQSFYPCYGLAESTLYVAGGAKGDEVVIQPVLAEQLEHHQIETQGSTNGPTRSLVGCGQPAPGHELLVVDPKGLDPCPENQVGEIWVRGPSVAQGYWNRPSETEATFQASLATSGERPYLRTGDLGMVLHGELFVTGRLKELMIIDGRNLYPSDIENTVAQCHPGFGTGGGIAFTTTAQGYEQLVIVYEVNREWLRMPLQPLISAIRRAIATEYEVSVCGIALVKPGGVPKTSSGKPQRMQCRQAYSEGTLETVLSWPTQASEGAAEA